MSFVETGLELILNSVTSPAERAIVERWKKEFNSLSFRQTRFEKILKAVAEGYNTMAEIAAETGIPSATARRLLLELASRKKITTNKVKNHNHAIEIRYEFPD